MSDTNGALTVQNGGELATLARESNPAAMYLLSLRSASSIYGMGRKLTKAAAMLSGYSSGVSWQTFPWAQVRAVHLEGIVSVLAAEHSPAYANIVRAAIRGVMTKAHDLELIDDKTERLIRKVKMVKGESTDPAGRYVPTGERNAIMATCTADTTGAGRRDAAIVSCGYPGGLRRAEIAGLQRQDVIDEGELVIVHLTGKGRKKRTVPFDNGGAEAIRWYLAIRGNEPGALFWRGHKGGKLDHGQGLTPQAVYGILKKRASQAGVRVLVPHDLRRTTASDLLDTSDTVTAARYLGHANESTTGKYDRRGDRAVRRASGGLHIAFTPPREL